MKKISIFAAVSILFACGAESPMMISHRGEYRSAPESSIPAYRLAAERKVDAIKLDLRQTKDGVIVLFHDVNLKRMMNWDSKVANATYDEIMKNCVYKKVGEYENEKIVVFRDVIPIIRDIPVFWLDHKAFTPDFFDRTIEELDAAKIPRDRLMLACYNEAVLRYAKKKYPDIRRVLHASIRQKEDGNWHLSREDGVWYSAGEKGPFPTRDDVFKRLIEKVRELELFGVNVPARPKAVDMSFIAELKKEGLWVSSWFVNNPRMAAYYQKAGSDAFVTADVRAARSGLVEKEK